MLMPARFFRLGFFFRLVRSVIGLLPSKLVFHRERKGIVSLLIAPIFELSFLLQRLDSSRTLTKRIERLLISWSILVSEPV